MTLLDLKLLSCVGLLFLFGFTLMSLQRGPGQPKVRFVNLLKIDRLLGKKHQGGTLRLASSNTQDPTSDGFPLSRADKNVSLVPCRLQVLRVIHRSL